MTRDEVRAVDRRAVAEYGLPGIVLMENAGRGAAELLASRGIDGRVAICCGRGNNGGDGFTIARHLENRGYSVRVLLFADPDDVRGDARVNLNVLQRAGTPLRIFGKEFDAAELDAELQSAEWIVDALLGTGITGEIRAPFDMVIDAINRASKRVFAVDLPSGLDCDTGESLGCTIRAELTATFVARKVGFDVPTAAEFLGEVHVVDIGVPRVMLDDAHDPHG